jgi:hypothetical protein
MAVWSLGNAVVCAKKAKPITLAAVIEKMVLPPSRQRFNLQLRVHSRIQPGNQPRKIWKQSLAFIALETIHLFFAETQTA